MLNAFLFHVFGWLYTNHVLLLQRDIQYLFELLSSRKIRPNIDRFITRDDIYKVSVELQNNPAAGDVICELRSTDY